MLRRAALLTARHHPILGRHAMFPAAGVAAATRGLPTSRPKSDMPVAEGQQQQEQRQGVGVVPLDDVHALPHHFHHLSNELLFHLAKNQIHGACRERLIREVMRVEGVSWEEAYKKVDELNRENDEGAWLVTFPYRVGFTLGVTAAITSLPLVFDLDTVLWFNDAFVHEDLPDGGPAGNRYVDYDAIAALALPYVYRYVMGTLSFILLGFQFARAQMTKLGARPYTEMLLSYRADRLARRYPQYNRSIVREFSKTDSWTE